MQKTTILSCTLSLLCVLFVSCAFSPAYAENVALRFAPPDGLSFIENNCSTMSQESSQRPKETQQVIMKRRVTIHKTAAGYTVAFAPIMMSRSKNGVKQDDVSSADLKNGAITYVLDSKGKLLELRGLDATINAQLQKMKPEERMKFPTARYKESLLQRYQLEWKQEVMQFVGMTQPIGITRTIAEKSPIPGQKIRKFTGYVTVNGKKCIRLLETFHVDSNALVAAMNKKLAGASSKSGRPQTTRVLHIDHQRTEEHIMDPSVSWSYSLNSTNTETMVMAQTGTGKSHPSRMTIKTIETITRTCQFK